MRLLPRPIRPASRNLRTVAARGGAAGLLGLAVAGCGEISNTFSPTPGTANTVKVMLAGPPSAFYVGLYEAQAQGYFKASDINLEIEVPAAGQDPVQELHDGNVLAAFASTPTVLLHRNQNQPVVGIASIVDAPLSAIKVAVPAPGATVTSPSSTTPTAPATVTAPTGGSPVSTTAAIAPGTTMTAQASPTPTTTAPATTTTPTTTATEPDANLWTAQLRTLIKGSGVPGYDGLVVVARKGSIVNDAPLLRRFTQALARGYRAARANPAGAVSDLIAQVPALASSQALQLATVQAAMPYFFPASGQIWGWQAPVLWNTFGTWMTDNKVIDNTNALTDSSTNELLQGEGV